MLYDAIVVPFDGSASARAALDEAVRFAREDPGLVLHVIQIADLEQAAVALLESKGVDMSESAVPMGMRDAVEAVTQQASERLRTQVDGVLRSLMNEKRVSLLPEVHPGDQIVQYAKDNGCDLIIMGSRGLGALRGMLGSVSSYVLREATVPVLVVKAGE